jgi:uncharacterized protein YndB with AHSA1/START domain
LPIIMLVIILCATLSAQEVGPVINEGIVDAPLEKVWAAWSTSDGLRSWLAPHADIDLRLGGLMRTNYNASGTLGDSQTIENVILSFEPLRMISIRVAKAPDRFPFPNAIQRMWTVIYFEAVDSARTRVRSVSLGFEANEESQKMRAFFAEGNATTLTQLQRHFARTAR